MTLSIVDPKSRAAPKRRILVVDDDLDSVHTMTFLLKDMGHEVEFAINGFAALEIARRFLPEVILLDITLPDMSGVEIARQLKWEAGLKHTVVVAVSAHSDELHRKKALDAGCSEYHVKPLDVSVLERLVAKDGRT